MIRQYERQPIDNATVLVLDDNGTQSLIVEPYDGYKIRKKGDDTYSTMQVGIPMQFLSLLNEYHTVSIDEPDEPDEAIEEEDNAQSTDNEEISAEEALSIIIGGTYDDQS